MVDEQTFTPWADPGWESWDEWSPEVGFCEFVAVVQRMVRPAIVLETGVGVGRLTGFLDLGACTYLGFEHDPHYRTPPAEPDRAGPDVSEMTRADLVILDSDPSQRLDEIAMWAEHGKPGSVCVVHDAGNGHATGSIHLRVRDAIEAAAIHGIFLSNPRGGWLAQHP